MTDPRESLPTAAGPRPSGGRLLRALDRLVGAVAGLCVAATAVAVCLNVFYRYVLASGLVWADELPGFLLVWIAFLGAYLAARDDGHIAFDLLVAKLPRPLSGLLSALVELSVAGFALLMVWLSLAMIRRVGWREIETLPLPQGLFMAVLPVAFALIALALALRAGFRLRHGGRV
ncbi:TRAP-type C4-dicarboxylate transport system, small permease component [Tistlia consotensis]|uniref:TRAP transporter small permease protein n=1 Tax=Tistlia consotensis USBA 355 TaxID=560819 RepID=A0A1Y6B6Q3_9PROT|nr:TRAP transporter small permease [Tistlia consotensis]SME93682.1 TRAP-type C4-dicarboxylate transport system, small permease component [Tistlia consotensis USBA 355]SNR28736.1 TRAP-type C4-dicarboxylate transport system, small permease component [Tistlia consotensis]